MPVKKKRCRRALLNRGDRARRRERLGRRHTYRILPDRALRVGRKRTRAGRTNVQGHARRVIARARSQATSRLNRQRRSGSDVHDDRVAALDRRVVRRQIGRQEVARDAEVDERRRIAVALLRVALLRGVDGAQ